MHLVEVFQPNREAKIDGSDEILNFEVDKLDIVAQFLDDSGKLSSSEVCIMFVSCSCTHQLARSEDKRSASRLSDPHNDTMKSLWIVFGISRAVIDCL